jgi:hypothetical protein
MNLFLNVGDASSKMVWQPGSRHDRGRRNPRLIRCHDGPEEGAEAHAGDADPLPIDLRAAQQPVDHHRPGIDPVLHRHINPEQRAFVLARAVDGQDRDAARHPAIVRQRHACFLEAVHAGDGDDHRELAAAVAGRQMEPGRDRVAFEWNRHRFDLVVRQPRVAGVAFPLLRVQGEVLPARIVVGPLGRAVVDRRHVPVVARRHEIALGFPLARLGLSSFRGALEGRADVGHFLHAGADGREIGIGLDPARGGEIDRSRLVLVDPIGANDIVESPPLLGETLGRRRTVGFGQRRDPRGDESHPDSPCCDRIREAATVHGDISLSVSLTWAASAQTCR